jgi:hypothetical protein
VKANKKVVRSQKRTYFWDFFFLASWPVAIGIWLILKWDSDTIGGAALGGSLADGKFLVVTYYNASDSSLNRYMQVTATAWIANLVLSLIALCLGLLVIASMGFFFFKYMLPYVRARTPFKGPDNEL